MSFQHPVYGDTGLREMTSEEIAERERLEAEMPPPTPTEAERIAQLERLLYEKI